MTIQTISTPHRQAAIDLVSPAPQVSVNAETVLAGSEVDARVWKSLVYTVKVAGNNVTWAVYGANLADYSDETQVLAPTNVNAGSAGSYAVAQAPYAYYRVKISSTVGGAHGTATVVGIAKG